MGMDRAHTLSQVWLYTVATPCSMSLKGLTGAGVVCWRSTMTCMHILFCAKINDMQLMWEVASSAMRYKRLLAPTCSLRIT